MADPEIHFCVSQTFLLDLQKFVNRRIISAQYEIADTAVHANFEGAGADFERLLESFRRQVILFHGRVNQPEIEPGIHQERVHVDGVQEFFRRLIRTSELVQINRPVVVKQRAFLRIQILAADSNCFLIMLERVLEQALSDKRNRPITVHDGGSPIQLGGHGEALHSVRVVTHRTK